MAVRMAGNLRKTGEGGTCPEREEGEDYRERGNVARPVDRGWDSGELSGELSAAHQSEFVILTRIGQTTDSGTAAPRSPARPVYDAVAISRSCCPCRVPPQSRSASDCRG